MREAVERLAREAGEIALRHFGRLGSAAVTSKHHLDLVTVADREVESFLSRGLLELYPDDGIYGEEGAASSGRSGRTWVIDPIDGTFNFVRGTDSWAISIGLYAEGRPLFGVVHAPVRRQTFSGGIEAQATCNGDALASLQPMQPSRAVTGLGFHIDIPIGRRMDVLRYVMEDASITFRHNGSAAISLIEIASGQSDGYIGLGEATWDVMGALPILSSIGAGTTLDWNRISLSSRLDFACGGLDFVALMSPLFPRVGGPA
jgi:myo-inositol-1(or 4)-monophosphatase